jgi:hypothetical protein
MERINDLYVLKGKISTTRAKMNALWEQRGCTDKDVLAVSVELDRLLNLYQKLAIEKKTN